MELEKQLDNFITCYGKDIYSFCLYLTKNRNEADDLYQDTFIRALEWQELPSEENAAKNLFLGTAIRLWKDKKRKYARQKRITEDKYLPLVTWEATVKSDTLLPEKQLLEQERRAIVRECVDKLPEKMKPVVLLYYMEERQLNEISEIMGIPLGTVKSRLHKAKKYLAESLSDYQQDTGDI